MPAGGRGGLRTESRSGVLELWWRARRLHPGGCPRRSRAVRLSIPHRAAFEGRDGAAGRRAAGRSTSLLAEPAHRRVITARQSERRWTVMTIIASLPLLLIVCATLWRGPFPI